MGLLLTSFVIIFMQHRTFIFSDVVLYKFPKERLHILVIIIYFLQHCPILSDNSCH